jgi:hypothetical protein
MDCCASNDSAMESNNTNSEEEDTTTTMSSKKDYFKVVNEKIQDSNSNGTNHRKWPKKTGSGSE